jgi:hypothetical protein
MYTRTDVQCVIGFVRIVTTSYGASRGKEGGWETRQAGGRGEGRGEREEGHDRVEFEVWIYRLGERWTMWEGGNQAWEAFDIWNRDSLYTHSLLTCEECAQDGTWETKDLQGGRRDRDASEEKFHCNVYWKR